MLEEDGGEKKTLTWKQRTARVYVATEGCVTSAVSLRHHAVRPLTTERQCEPQSVSHRFKEVFVIFNIF